MMILSNEGGVGGWKVGVGSERWSTRWGGWRGPVGVRGEGGEGK